MLQLWDLKTGKLRREFIGRGVPHPVHSIAVSADGQRVLAGGDGKTLHLWDLRTGKLIYRLVNKDIKP